jgi:hypothetical protein
MCTDTDRPAFDDLCDCVNIIVRSSQQPYVDGANKEQRKQLMRSIYNGGADFYINVDCHVCNGSGVISTAI